ncbi:MAG: ATP-dependent DNA helicase [Nitrospinales bacterium]
MDEKTIIYWGLGIVIFIWLLARNKEDTTKTTVTYTDPKTSGIKKELKKTRKPQNRLVVDKPEGFEINEEIKEVLSSLENTNQNIFLTGKAGTGKSTLLNYFRATSRKDPIVVAPTGVAAVNVQGQTIHSFFGWGINIAPDRVRKVSYEKGKIYRNMKMLIVDEISMVRADLFECIDKFLRLNTGKQDLPFGGVQIVVIGDLYQLPPVVLAQEKKYFEEVFSSPFFFSTEGFDIGSFKKYELNKVYRQKDPEFVATLNAIREGVADDNHIDLLNKTVIEEEPEDFEDYVHLVTTNKMAKEINDKRMSRLSAEPVTYKGSIHGTFKEKDAPTDLELKLKTGALVMLLNNDRERKWVNGDVVKVLETRSQSVLVEFNDGTVHDVGIHSWETIRFIFDEEEQKIVPTKIGGFTQIPIKPAWAMTIHKAQGKTFEKVFMDLGSGAFAEGQTYVALSRCKTIEGLKLASPLTPHDIFVNEKVKSFMSFTYGQDKPIARSKSKLKPTEKSKYTPEKNNKKIEEKLSVEEFVLNSINNLRTKNYKGIHVVYSGFNKAFREYFDADPVESVKELEKKGLVKTRPVKGGVMLYASNENIVLGSKKKGVSSTLSKILNNNRTK